MTLVSKVGLDRLSTNAFSQMVGFVSRRKLLLVKPVELCGPEVGRAFDPLGGGDSGRRTGPENTRLLLLATL